MVFNEEDFDKIKQFAGKSGYDRNNPILQLFQEQIEKLERLAVKVFEKSEINIERSRREKINRQAGWGADSLNWTTYLLVGFNENKNKYDKTLFLKFAIHELNKIPYLTIEVDVDRSSKHKKAGPKLTTFVESHNKTFRYNEPLKYNHDFDSYSNDIVNETKQNFSVLLRCQNYFNTIMETKALISEISDKIDVLEYKKQIILQGPPGTGKTYTAKDIAEYMILGEVSTDKKLQKGKLENTEQFKLVQFHPSYSYEDFVRGISANSANGEIEYVSENKAFAEFAELAKTNLDESKKDQTDFSKEKWVKARFKEFAETIQDKISNNEDVKLTDVASIMEIETEKELFRYTGKDWKWAPARMKFKDLIHGYMQNAKTRHEFKELEGVSKTAKNRASYFFKTLELFRESITGKEPDFNKTEKPELKNYILIIDEINRANLPSVLGELIYSLEYRNETVQSIYAVDDDTSLVIPENLYIIGTMNTADRSVGHIDYAIKRRFAFIDMLPDQNVIQHKKAKELFLLVSELFTDDYLASDFDKKDVQLGHSYFIVEDDEELKMKLKYEILPILNEYIKDGLLMENSIDKLKEIEYFVI